MVVDNYAQFQTLGNLGIAGLVAGDLLLKKIFKETTKTGVEKVITGAQRTLKSPEKVKVSQGWFCRKEKILFENKGSSTSEHAAVVINNGMMAEAVGEGVIQATSKSRAHERYIVYRCSNLPLRDAAVRIAEGLSLNRVGSSGGKYSLGGAAISSFRNSNFQQSTWFNRRVTSPTEKFLNDVIDYVFGVTQRRPNMFCSEFAATCYEAGSLAAFGKTALGTSPRAMSPMELENALNYRPDLFTLIGRVEMPADILHEALTEAVTKYGKSLGGMFRKPSPESLQALEVFRFLLEMGPTDYLFSAVEHYTSFVSKVPYDSSCAMDLITPPLKTDSTFYKLLREHLQHTALFHM
jgi:hypothetical protein